MEWGKRSVLGLVKCEAEARESLSSPGETSAFLLCCVQPGKLEAEASLLSRPGFVGGTMAPFC